jgi:hypothetical protein
MSLATLQERFHGAILCGDDTIVADIAEGGAIGPRQRLGIYRDAYRLRLLEALRENFAGLTGLLGDDGFDAMAGEFIARHPSRHRSIRWYGDGLARFLESAPRYRERPWLAEMARLDWAMLSAFDAADAGAVGVDDLASLPADAWPGMTIRFHPSVVRLDLHWSVAPFRRAVVAGEKDVAAPERSEGPVPWLVWRQDMRQFFRSLDSDEAHAMDAARAGADFATVCGGLCEWVDEDQAPARAASFLKRWVIDQLVVDVQS